MFFNKEQSIRRGGAVPPGRRFPLMQIAYLNGDASFAASIASYDAAAPPQGGSAGGGAEAAPK